MAKATIRLPNGTLVTIEGTPDEVCQLMEFYGGKASSPRKSTSRAAGDRFKKDTLQKDDKTAEDSRLSLSEIINLVKNCDIAEAIETNILDKTSQVDRTLLPLYMVHEYLDNKYALTSGDISQITSDLGIPISMANASRTLSGTASRYVIGDKVRKKGQPVHYKLSRRGVHYLKSILAGTNSEK